MEMTATAAYKTLLADHAPMAIRTEAENDAAVRKIEELIEHGGEAEENLANLLMVLVEAFEEENYQPIRKATPVDVLRHLMDVNHLKQKDLLKVFGSPSIVSEVLGGKRGLTVEHIKKLSRRFHVSAEVFI
jgi:HTH-type transcriptional regulator/antitoxin HigA